MIPKPHRFLLDRVAGYAEEAAAYLRRRRLLSRPFARVWWPGGRAAGFEPDGERGRSLFLAAAALIELADDER